MIALTFKTISNSIYNFLALSYSFLDISILPLNIDLLCLFEFDSLITQEFMQS